MSVYHVLKKWLHRSGQKPLLGGGQVAEFTEFNPFQTKAPKH